MMKPVCYILTATRTAIKTHNENIMFLNESLHSKLLLLTEFTIGKGGSWGFGFDSLSRNLTKAVDKDASRYCKNAQCIMKLQLSESSDHECKQNFQCFKSDVN